VLQVPFGEGEEAEAAVDHRCGDAMFLRREAQRLLPMPAAGIKVAQKAQHQRQPRVCLDPVIPLGIRRASLQRRHVLPQEHSGLAQVTARKVRLPQTLACGDLHGAVAERGGNVQGLLTGCHGARVLRHHPEEKSLLDQHLSEPGPVVECLGQDFGLLEVGQRLPVLAQQVLDAEMQTQIPACRQ